jgi:polysaccharide export outer membrane protein
MKTVNKLLVVLITATIMVSSSASAFAQTSSKALEVNRNKTRQRFATKDPEPAQPSPQEPNAPPGKLVRNEMETKKQAHGARVTDAGLKNVESELLPDPADSKQSVDSGPATETRPSEVPAETEANRHEQASEEAAVVPYYNNFFNTYRLGPEDVVSVSVFGQDRYSRSGIVIPPSGRISLALIPGGVFVNGKTVEEVADSIKKRYDEFIIDPQVSVSLDKASSYRYSVIGDVGQPGIRLMSRRLTVAEAVGEAGGVLSTGNRSKIVVLRRQADGKLTPIAVNLTAIYQGKAPDVTYLVPGDQVIVPGNKMKSFQKIMTFFPILSFARIFTGGVWP